MKTLLKTFIDFKNGITLKLEYFSGGDLPCISASKFATIHCFNTNSIRLPVDINIHLYNNYIIM